MQESALLRVSLLPGLAVAFLTSCDRVETTAPRLTMSLAANTQQLGLPQPVPYGATVYPGEVVVCTSQLSPAGFQIYEISGSGLKPKDEIVPTVTLSPGECAVVFQTQDRGNAPTRKITVVPIPPYIGNVEGAEVFQNAGLTQDTCASQVSFNVTGKEGATVKQFFSGTSLGVNAVCDGGHGGTGT